MAGTFRLEFDAAPCLLAEILQHRGVDAYADDGARNTAINARH